MIFHEFHFLLERIRVRKREREREKEKKRKKESERRESNIYFSNQLMTDFNQLDWKNELLPFLRRVENPECQKGKKFFFLKQKEL